MLCGTDDYCHPSGVGDVCVPGPDGAVAVDGPADAIGGPDGSSSDSLTAIDGSISTFDADPCGGFCSGGDICWAPCNCCCEPSNTLCCTQC